MGMVEDNFIVPKVDIAEYTFPATARARLIQYLEPLRNKHNPYFDHEDMKYAVAYRMVEALKESCKIPEEEPAARAILGVIEDIRNHKTPPAFVIHNFPCDAPENLINSPTDLSKFDPTKDESLGKKGHIAEWSMLAFNTACGHEVVGKKNMQHGNVFQHVTPLNGSPDKPYHGGTGDFPVHIEAAYLPEEEMLDAVCLLTLKNQKTATIVVPIKIIEAELRKNLGDRFEILKQPRFKFEFKNDGHTDTYIVPIIETDEHTGKIRRWRLQGNTQKFMAADPNDKEAVEIAKIVVDTIQGLKQGYVSKHADFVYINNVDGAAHSRTPLAPEDKGDPATKRHLIRQQTRHSLLVGDGFEKFVANQRASQQGEAKCL